MKRVVLIRSNPVFPDPPVEKMANSLIKFGYHVTILAWDRNSSHDTQVESVKLSNGSYDVIRFGIKANYGDGIKSLTQLLRFQIKIAKWLMKNKVNFDIIHCFDFDTGFTTNLMNVLLKKKVLYHILDFYIDSHNIKQKLLRRIVKKLEFNIIKKANITIICNEARKKQISGSKPKKLYIIHNTPDSSLSINEEFILRSKNDTLKIAYVGVLGDGRYLKEICEIVSEDLSLEFHVGGFGPFEEEIKKYAKLNKNINFYGKLKYGDTLALESKSDIMTAIYDPKVPNHKYAAPNKFYESLLLGKPVIAVKGTGIDKIIVEKDVGYIFDYSMESFKLLINEITLNTEDRLIKGKNAEELYKKSYSWNLMEDRIREMYGDL